MSKTEEKAIKNNFLAWSGGTAPDSPFEIFTYVQLAMPGGTDEDEVRLLLKAWMEETWRNPSKIENPAKSFKVFGDFDEK